MPPFIRTQDGPCIQATTLQPPPENSSRLGVLSPLPEQRLFRAPLVPLLEASSWGSASIRIHVRIREGFLVKLILGAEAVEQPRRVLLARRCVCVCGRSCGLPSHWLGPGLSKTASDEAPEKTLGVSLFPKQDLKHLLKRNPCTLTFHPQPCMGMKL